MQFKQNMSMSWKHDNVSNIIRPHLDQKSRLEEQNIKKDYGY